MRQLLRRLFGSPGAGKLAARPRRVRLGLEPLEDRALPSVTPLGDVTGFSLANQVLGSDRTVARSSATGNFAVTWYAHGTGGNGAYVRLFRADGTALTSPIRLGYMNFDFDINPSVAMNAQGQFAVAWVHGFGTSDTDVHVQRFNADGTLWGLEQKASSTVHNEYEPSVALDDYGNLMVAYTSDYTSTDQDIYVWTRRASGATNTFPFAVTGRNEHAPSLALNGQGEGVIACEYDYGFGDHDILAQRVSTGGAYGSGGYINSVQSALKVAAGGAYNSTSLIWVNSNGASQSDPSVAINASGAFVVSYTEMQSYGPQVVARHYDAVNNFLGEVAVGAAGDTRAEYASSVAIDSYGRFIVAYTHAWSSTDDDVLAQVFNSDNSVRDGAFSVAASGAYSERRATVALGVNDLTSNYSGNGMYGQAVFAFQVFGEKPIGYLSSTSCGYGVSAAWVYNL